MVERIIIEGETVEEVWLNAPAQDVLFRQQACSTLRLHILHLSGKPASINVLDHIRVEQEGTGCLTEIYALNCLAGEDEAVLHTDVRHTVGGGRSRQVVKYVLTGRSKGAFRGDVLIAQDARQTDVEQRNRNILLSDTATMRTQPQLEIYADDVKASHGASTGKLDESALFYMRQRCLSEQEGRRLLLKAFLEDITEGITDEEKRRQSVDAIDSVIEQLQ